MKHSYQTRRLLALRDMRHDGQDVVIGGEVFATQTDAGYLIRTGQAADPAEVEKKAEEAAGAQRRRVGRPSKAEAATRAQAPIIDTPPDDGTQNSDAGDGAGGSGDPQAN